MTAEELNAFLVSQEIRPDRNKVIADGEYRCPTRDWVLGALYSAFKRRIDRFGLGEYVRERNDCDDFARRFAEHAATCHALTPDAGETGLALGTFYYMPDDSEDGHAINVAVLRTEGGHELLFIEPQNGTELKLNITERRSCFGYSFA